MKSRRRTALPMQRHYAIALRSEASHPPMSDSLSRVTIWEKDRRGKTKGIVVNMKKKVKVKMKV